jgi:hypothetical protein
MRIPEKRDSDEVGYILDFSGVRNYTPLPNIYYFKNLMTL